MEQLVTKINEICPLPEEEMRELLKSWMPITLQKSHVLLNQGEICTNIYYVQKGGLRCFRIQDEKDITEWIVMDGSFCYPPISLFKKQPSRLCVQTIEPTVLYAINFETFDRLCLKYHMIERFFRHLLMIGVLAAERRIEALMTGTAHQRYKHLTSRFPDIIKRVPLAHIASYIGITQETLSRIRGIKEMTNIDAT